jgi:hypothetical protein
MPWLTCERRAKAISARGGLKQNNPSRERIRTSIALAQQSARERGRFSFGVSLILALSALDHKGLHRTLLTQTGDPFANRGHPLASGQLRP